MTRRSYLSLVVLGALALTTLPKAAHAADFIYTLTGTGGFGSIRIPGVSDTPFTGANFTLTGLGNTTNTTTFFGVLPAIHLTSLTYNISGVTLGDATATLTTIIYDVAPFGTPGTFGFGDTVAAGGVQFKGPGLVGWDMASPISPVTVHWDGSNHLATSQGDIALTGWSSATFSAAPYSVTPEAPGLVQLLPGLLPLGALALRLAAERFSTALPVGTRLVK